MALRLRRIILVFGGVREAPLEGAVEHRTRSTKKRLKPKDDRPLKMVQRRETEHVNLYPEEWKTVRSFVNTCNRFLKNLCYSTPVGRIALKSVESELIDFKEKRLLPDAAVVNSQNTHWHVLDELVWTELDEFAKSELLRIMGGELPDIFWEDTEEHQ